jgi:hypothetical protein
MSAQADTELLQLEKLRAELIKLSEDAQTEYARRHNWAEQEAFWQRSMRNWESQEAFWEHEAKMSRGRNYIAFGAVVASITVALGGIIAAAATVILRVH